MVGFGGFERDEVEILKSALDDELRDVKYFELEALVQASQTDCSDLALKHYRVSYFCVHSYRYEPF